MSISFWKGSQPLIRHFHPIPRPKKARRARAASLKFPVSRASRSKKAPQKAGAGSFGSTGRVLIAGIVGAGAVAAIYFAGKKQSPAVAIEAPPTGPVTYSEHVAPILYKECAICHRPGQTGPFNLLTYEDAKNHSRDIVRVTSERIMPPWLPEHGVVAFNGERRLSDVQIQTIKLWVENGVMEGDRSLLPAAPDFSKKWQLGEPDLVVEPDEYTLPPDGTDVYYNFVLPIPTSSTRFVSGVEFLPESRNVHHAFIMIDETRKARRQAAHQTPPGYYGMDQPETVGMPGGQLLGWQPGKIPRLNPTGLAWILKTNTDLVLQVHMNPSGKPEKIRPKVGFYFTNQAPTNTAYRLRLNSLFLDIPAGVSNYVTEISYTLPVDLQMVRVGGHAHYLCKEMQGFAILPNGERKWLLHIKDWDFKWQGDYEYKDPILLPRGSKVSMRFTYDNSANNIRNPFNPPKPVLWGLGTTDEMGELYFQTLPKGPEDYQAIAADFGRYFARFSQDYYRFKVQRNPGDAEMQQRLGRSLASFGEFDEALAHLLEAVRLNPKDDLAYFDLGSIYLRQNRPADAFTAFQNVIRINPDDSQAFGSLGILATRAGRIDEARRFFTAALRIDPDDQLARQYLQRLEGQ